MIGFKITTWKRQKSIKAYKVFRKDGIGYMPMYHSGWACENIKILADKIPTWSNNHGWWAFKTRAAAREMAKDAYDGVVRMVRLSGSIIVYSKGYRAEFMKIIPREKS